MLNNKSEQNGRSMVEMLGVLAVIGVLSITGISGYTTAMNKHKANQILDAASKRAVAVSTQIQRGNTNPTLAEFDDNEVGGATFSDTVLNASGSAWRSTDTQFKIGFVSGKEPSDAVLTQMQAIAGEGGIIQSLTGGLTYNNDLTAGGGSGSDTGAGPTGSECTNKCTATSGTASCNDGYCECASGIWVPTSGTDSTVGTCTLTGTPETGCYTNKDCNDGQEQGDLYCKYNNNRFDYDSNTGPALAGTCRSAKVKDTDYYELTTADDGFVGILSAGGNDWFSAKNFCQAHGKHMVNLKESFVTKESLGTFFNEKGYCSEPTSTTQNDACEGGLLASNYKGKLLNASWWTSDLSESSSAVAFYVSHSRVQGLSRYHYYYNTFKALCK